MGVIDQVLGAVSGAGQGYTAGRNQEIALARQQLLDRLMVQNMGSEQALRRSEIAKNERQASMPIPGTPEYLQYLLSLAQGKGNIATQTAVNTAAGVTPIKTAGRVAEVAQTTPITTAGRVAVSHQTVGDKVAVAGAHAVLAPRAQAARAVSPEMDSALSTLSQYDEPGAAGRLFQKHTLGGYGISAEGQVANQAAQQFARAYLSGRGMRNPSQSQIDAVTQQVLVQPGEENNAMVIAKKRAARQQMAAEVQQLGAPGANTGAVNTGTAAPKSKTGLFDDLMPTKRPDDEE